MRNRSENKVTNSRQGLTIESLLSSQNSPQRVSALQKNMIKFQQPQNSLSKRSKLLVEMPKIYPIHKKLFNLKSKDIELIKLTEKKFHLRGFKLAQDSSTDLFEQSTIDVEEFEKLTPTIKKKDSSSNSGLQNVFSELMLRMNNIKRFSPLKGYKLRVFVEEGNNSRLIKELLRKRAGVKLVANKSEAEIIWTRFADYQSIDRKSTYEETLRENNSDDLFCSQIHTSDQLLEAYDRFSSSKVPQDEKNIQNPTKSIQVKQFLMHNHLKNHEELSDKKNLFKNIRNYCLKNGIPENDLIPKTYHIDYHRLDSHKDLEQEVDSIFLNQKYTDQNVFVVKPGEDTNRGDGIVVVRGKENILKSVKQLKKLGKSSLIQEYIDPLLYKNRKFDIRCFVLITNVAGNLKAYWYREGYLRTCSKQFTYDTGNVFGHLTNDAVQKKCKDYGRYETANKLSYSELDGILGQTERTRREVVSQMKNLAFHSIHSAQNFLKAESSRVFSFQILGYDFLIDKKGKVWLIQINTNPCLEFAGSLLSRIIWHMVDNSFKIAVDPFLEVDPRKDFENYLQLNKYDSLI